MVVEQFNRVDDQTQHEEHHQLAEPCQSVEERLGLTLARELVVSYNQAGDIHRQIGVSL